MKLFIDVETIPIERPDFPINPIGPKKIETAWKNTALDSAYGELVCVGYALGDDVPHVVVRDFSQEHSEAELLRSFFSVIPPTIPVFVGHNVSFDLKFLAHRSMIHRVKPATKIPHTASAWSGKYIDTMFEWGGANHYVGLMELCRVLGVGPNDEDIDGASVWEYVARGDLETVARHCALDVERTRAVYRAMNYA